MMPLIIRYFTLFLLILCFFGLSPASAQALLPADLTDILKLNSGSKVYSRMFPAWLDWDNDKRITVIDAVILLNKWGDPDQPAPPGTYTLLAWNDLGMHCVDGNDYAVFSILPPYNNLHAQLLKKNDGLVTSGVQITFEAAANHNGALNTNSVTKTNFWEYAEPLYGFLYGGGPLPADQGLTRIYTQSRYPQAMTFDPGNQWWAADGIPILPYNDNGTKSYYQLVKVKALDNNGDLLAEATAVLPVSDEMDCRKCHGTTGNYTAAKPAAGWVNDADPEKDYKLNILVRHDEKNGTTLFGESTKGTPVLCARCHLSNALPGSGSAGMIPLTAAIHSRHAQVLDPLTGKNLDEDTNRTACYSCHPGQETKCLRGAMGGVGHISCQDCHGSMAAVGASNRQGWLDEPNCQQCHQNANRYDSVFISPGNHRPVTDRRFATQLDTPLPGKDLYRFSAGHHGLQCEACHGATHAIYPSIEKEDNILAREVQGHAGTIAECTGCHIATPETVSGGPHGIHSPGQFWVNAHGDAVEYAGTAGCTPCHGASLGGAPPSAAFSKRSLSTKWGIKIFSSGQQIGCYDCHNGPGGD